MLFTSARHGESDPVHVVRSERLKSREKRCFEEIAGKTNQGQCTIVSTKETCALTLLFCSL